MAKPLTIEDLTGGLNESDPAIKLPADQVVLAENIDFFRSPVAARRLGHSAITVSTLTGKVVCLHRHLPTTDETDAQLWGVSTSGSTSKFAYKDTSWHDVTPTGNDALDVTAGQYNVRAQTLHEKCFFAYPSSVDRLHVWDGTSIRRVGLAEPAAPTVANTGAGSYSTTRYFRQRYTEQVGGVTVRRSEPSDATTFSPSGTGASARVTKAAAISEGETHWEVEESIDGTNFYRIATVAVGTTTYDDSLASTAVATTGTLSADIGDYSLLHSPKFLSADQDRLLIAGSWDQPELGSRVAWTPVFGASGVGNDERLEDDTDPYLDLDGFDGGELTDFAGPIYGYHLAYKRKRIYKIVRTNARGKAYVAVPYTDASGALTRSVVKGLDEAGRPCQYYLDPDYGPSRVGAQGVERCGDDIVETWQSINLDAALPAFGEFLPNKGQVWWYVAEAGSSTPSLRLKVSVQAFTAGRTGARRGWSIDTGPYMAALCSTLFADNIEANAARSKRLVPYIGTAISGALIVQGETGSSDNGTGYRSRIRTKPFLIGGLLQKGRVVSMGISADASESDVTVSLIRDHGKETKTVRVSLRPTPAGETLVEKVADDATLSEVTALQVEIGDEAPSEADWVVNAVALGLSAEESR